MLASIHLAGGPYALVQACAWANMLITYSQQDGFAKAAVDTFSGEKPCEMCCKIAEAKQDDANKKKDPASPDLSFGAKLRPELLPADHTTLKVPAATDILVAAPVSPALIAGIGQAAPPSPPPQVA
ncbi:hypothetical protein KBB96_09185 [Luteolibacter ambystomatis]|uniref:Uncharacterized protein n=1 Tax=Luteolibacter ambystomatis TaxID=2824561 RepID=A0A975PH92_9BACT|nr:hypothetical protein [Luteolibacter ambystomatis]QUE53051.1 hypothetical protein KBB96_09185 [Luteolibacter ambystomatis]